MSQEAFHNQTEISHIGHTENSAEKISIVIPAYNCEDTIERCINSALSQTYGNLEIIVVDDGSEDGTAKILDGLQKEHDVIKVIRQENRGVSAARNAGMKAATGSWLVTLDADDYIDSDMLLCMHREAVLSEVQLVICGLRFVYEDSGRKEVRTASEDFAGNLSEFLNTAFLKLYDLQLLNNQNNKLYRLDLIHRHQIYYDTQMEINEDLWFSLKYLQYCSEVAVLRRPFLNYTQHEEGESLVSRFHDNCVETCFIVLKAYDELFDGRPVSDQIVNEMNNRMLFLICGYAGWQYYKSDYTEEQMLENIRSLCARPEFQKLLGQTDPTGLKNKTAYFLLKRGKAEAYHALCKLLYREKAKKRREAEAEIPGEKLPEAAAEEIPEAAKEPEEAAAETEVLPEPVTGEEETPEASEEAEAEPVPAQEAEIPEAPEKEETPDVSGELSEEDLYRISKQLEESV
ncbi:MAG: glycosyltransferase family 2 protein [Eubacteriales bacterium]|nr:glycosyltransferase family 2 protein [Eubacteriales bacterium]